MFNAVSLPPVPAVTVTVGQERARIYQEGGIGFEHFIRGIGWCVDDRPSLYIAKLARRVQLHCGWGQPLKRISSR
jgi:hypothetical protein